MRRHLRKIDLQDIKITDSLFGAYADKVSEKIIPHQWKILNNQLPDSDPTYCIDNFKIAAGEMTGKRKGAIFEDTDVYKWLEAVAYCISSHKGGQYEELADEVIELIERAQESDGYLDTYFTVNAPDEKWKNLVEGHELYTAGHLIEAAVAYHEATGKDRLLNVAARNADLICSIFGTEDGKIHGYPGHQEIELALVKLYRATGEKRYLDTAYYFISERGKKPNYFEEEIARYSGPVFFPEFSDYDLEYAQSQCEPVKQSDAVGHAVRCMYMCSGMADLAMECDDGELLDACNRIWDSTVNKRMYITGGIGTSGFRERFTTDYDLPNATNYSETCASIGLMMFGQRMNAVTGDASYYDTVERALYNTVLAGINMEGDRYFYVNPLEVVPEFCTEHTYMDHVKAVRQKWFSVACCPPNVARTLASLGQYIYASEANNIFIQQYISSDIDTDLDGSHIALSMISELLQSGKIEITADVSDTKSGKCGIRLRLPEYAGKWSASIDGVPVHSKVDMGYICIDISEGSHKISVDLDVRPRWVGTRDEVRADVGMTALQKGPLVYCLESVDNGRFLSEIYVRDGEKIEEGVPETSFYGDIPTLNFHGIRIHNKGVDPGRLYGDFRIEKENVDIRAIPYCLWNNRGECEMKVWQNTIF